MEVSKQPRFLDLQDLNIVTLGVAPFYVYVNTNRPWMCLLRALAVWWVLAQEQNNHLDGFVFRKRVGSDGISVNSTDGMVRRSSAPLLPSQLIPSTDIQLLSRVLSQQLTRHWC